MITILCLGISLLWDWRAISNETFQTHRSYISFDLLKQPCTLLIFLDYICRYVNGAGGQLGAYGSADYDVQCIAVAKIPEVRYCDECHFACYVYVEHNIITGYSGTSCQDDSVNAGAYVCTCCAWMMKPQHPQAYHGYDQLRFLFSDSLL